MKTAYSYIRFSTKTQEFGDSLRRQLQATQKYCKDNNLILSDTSYQDLGISGFRDKQRASLEDLLEAVTNGSIKRGSVIILESVDRLSRAGIDKTLDLVKSILQHHVDIISLHDDLHLTFDSLNDLGLVIRLALSADLAYQESLKKSKRILAVKAKQREQAASGQVINRRLVWWLEHDKENNKYVFSDRVAYVRKMIELRRAGNGYHKIAMYFNDNNILSRYGKKWSDTTIREMLLNPAIYGAYRTVEKKVILDYFPALITYAEYKEFKGDFINRAGGIAHVKHNHLSGIVRCGKCGSSMQKKVSNRKLKNGTRYYNQWLCINSLANACDFKTGIRDLDKHVLKACSRLNIEPIKVDNGEEALIDSLTERLEMQKKKLRAVDGTDDVKFEIILEAVSATKKELDSVVAKFEEQTPTNITEQDITKLESLFDDVAAFNIQLKKLIKSVVVVKKEKNSWLIKLNQRNGYSISCTVFRKTERSPFQYLFSTTDLRELEPKLNEWEKY